MGNANEQGLAIGETTHGGLSVLSNVGKTAANGTIMDYNNLISVTLQRASTAREAIKTMAWLANTYGYASDMEGFSIADSDEVWYMELIGKGSFEKGVVWVALASPTATSAPTPTRRASPRSCRATTRRRAWRRPTPRRSRSSTGCGAASPTTPPSPSPTSTTR